MSDYSMVNFMDVEDSSKNKEDGARLFTRKHLDSRDLGVSLFRYPPNFRATKGHKHRVQEEAYVVIKGSGNILLNDETKPLKLWDVIRVAPEVNRAFEAGADGLDIIAVGGPKPEGGDGELQDASWPEYE